jgi:hypothetical protein
MWTFEVRYANKSSFFPPLFVVASPAKVYSIDGTQRGRHRLRPGRPPHRRENGSTQVAQLSGWKHAAIEYNAPSKSG